MRCAEVLLLSDSYYTVVRDDTVIDIKIGITIEYFHKANPPFIELDAPFEVHQVVEHSPAALAGILPGDRIIKANEQRVVKFLDFLTEIDKDDDGRIMLEVERSNVEGINIVSINLFLNGNKRIGIVPRELINYGVRKNSFFEAVQKGTSRAFGVSYANIRAFARVIAHTLVPKETLNAPIGVARLKLIYLTGIYAIIFAFWNLLPLPMSTFWEIIPLIYESLTKKKYSYKTLRTSRILIWIPAVAFYVWIFVSDSMILF